MHCAIVLRCCFLLAGVAPLAANASAPERVAMFRGNPQLTGVYDSKPVYALHGVKFTFKTDGPIRGTPAVVDGVAYFGSGDGNFYAIDAQSGKERWRFTTGGGVHSSPAVFSGNVYFASRDGYLYALSGADGKQQWKFALGKELGNQNYWDYYLSSPSIFAGTLYIGSGDGNVYALDPQTGSRLWKFDAGSRVRSTPAVTRDAVVFGTMSGHVYAINRKDGKQIWKFATKGATNKFADRANDTTSIFSSPSIGNGVVAIGGRDAFVYGIDLASGKQKWKTTHDGSSWILSTAIAGANVYVGSGSASIVQAADLQTGKEKWRFKTVGAVFSSLTLAGDVIYFADFSGNTYALDKNTGVERWRFPMGHRSLSTPVVADGVVYCSSDDGVLYALDGSENSPASPSPSTRRIVYWEGRKSKDAFSWFVNNVDTAILNYFKAAGYEQLDAQQLAELMQQESAGHAHSVVVFADNKIPASVVEVESDQALVRRYLNAGGKIALLGANPLAYHGDPKTGVVEKIDYTLPQKVFGIQFLEPNETGGYYASRATTEGERWGLHGFSITIGAIDPGQATQVLASDEYGMASSWVKNYGGPEGTGLLQLSVPRMAPADLSQYQAAIEHGLN